MRGAWIEISNISDSAASRASLPVRGAWIEIKIVFSYSYACCPSLPVRGAWIEISQAIRPTLQVNRRSPCGERGLKCIRWRYSLTGEESLPVRGAWIEIPLQVYLHHPPQVSLPVRGAWIEISSTARSPHSAFICRSPCGERGLKSDSAII